MLEHLKDAGYLNLGKPKLTLLVASSLVFANYCDQVSVDSNRIAGIQYLNPACVRQLCICNPSFN